MVEYNILYSVCEIKLLLANKMNEFNRKRCGIFWGGKRGNLSGEQQLWRPMEANNDYVDPNDSNDFQILL